MIISGLTFKSYSTIYLISWRVMKWKDSKNLIYLITFSLAWQWYPHGNHSWIVWVHPLDNCIFQFQLSFSSWPSLPSCMIWSWRRGSYTKSIPSFAYGKKFFHICGTQCVSWCDTYRKLGFPSSSLNCKKYSCMKQSPSLSTIVHRF